MGSRRWPAAKSYLVVISLTRIDGELVLEGKVFKERTDGRERPVA